MRLVSAKRVSVTRRTTALKLRLSCDEPCAIGAEGNLRTTVGKKKRIAPLPFVDHRKAQRRPKGTQTVTVKLGRLALADMRRALKAGRGAQVFLRITAVDEATNASVLRATISLRAKKTRR